MRREIKIKKMLPIFFSLILVLTFTSCGKEESSEQTTEDFAVDTRDPHELVGFADYYFVAEVIDEIDTEYRHPVIMEGKEEIGSPYTNYKIKVQNNIKGELPLDEEINVTKAGGVYPDGETFLYEDDALLEEGKTYIITASAQADGSLLISGPNSSKEYDPKDIEKYQDIYDNEVKFDRERYQFKNK